MAALAEAEEAVRVALCGIPGFALPDGEAWSVSAKYASGCERGAAVRTSLDDLS